VRTRPCSLRQSSVSDDIGFPKDSFTGLDPNRMN
jgi:hypothetical protein